MEETSLILRATLELPRRSWIDGHRRCQGAEEEARPQGSGRNSVGFCGCPRGRPTCLSMDRREPAEAEAEVDDDEPAATASLFRRVALSFL